MGATGAVSDPAQELQSELFLHGISFSFDIFDKSLRRDKAVMLTLPAQHQQLQELHKGRKLQILFFYISIFLYFCLCLGLRKFLLLLRKVKVAGIKLQNQQATSAQGISGRESISQRD